MIVLIMVLGILPIVSFGAEIKDFQGHWAEKQINYFRNKNIIVGYPDGSFKPDNNISKAEFYSIVNKIIGYREKATINYVDVKKEDWFYEHIQKAEKAGYAEKVKELKANTFITRQEVARILSLVFDVEENEEVVKDFKDYETIPINMRGIFGGLIENKYLTGYPDKTLRPTRLITRAEVVTMLHKLTGQILVSGDTYEEDIKTNALVNGDRVTLKDMKIEGDLYLSQGIGEGEVTLDNIEVVGKLSIKGGGANSVFIKNSTINTIVVDRKDGLVRLVLDNTSAKEIKAYGQAIVEIITGTEIENVILDGRIGFQVDKGATIETLEVANKEVLIEAKGNIKSIKTNQDIIVNGVIVEANTEVKVESGNKPAPIEEEKEKTTSGGGGGGSSSSKVTNATVKDTAEFKKAIENNDIKTIILGANISGNVEASRTGSTNYTINFANYVLTGNLNITADNIKVLNLSGAAVKSVTGQLVIDAKQATVTNNIGVGGDIIINNLNSDTWIEKANDNNLTINAPNVTINIKGESAKLTANKAISITIEKGALLGELEANVEGIKLFLGEGVTQPTISGSKKDTVMVKVTDSDLDAAIEAAKIELFERGDMLADIYLDYVGGESDPVFATFAKARDDLCDLIEGGSTDKATIVAATNALRKANDALETAIEAKGVNLELEKATWAGWDELDRAGWLLYMYENEFDGDTSAKIFTDVKDAEDALFELLDKGSTDKASIEAKTVALKAANNALKMRIETMPIMYTVTFDKNGGEQEANPKTKKVEEGTAIGEFPIPPEKTDYKFIGWATSKTATEPDVTGGTVITGNTTFYAVWEFDMQTVTVGELQGGSIYKGIEAVGRTYEVTTTKMENGKEVTVDWYEDVDGTTAADSAPAGITVQASGTIVDNKAILNVSVNEGATKAGSYYFKVEVDGVESVVRKLTVNEPRQIIIGSDTLNLPDGVIPDTDNKLSYDYATNTLTMNNYEGTYIEFKDSSLQGITVKVVGECTLEGYYGETYSLYYSFNGSLGFKITGEDSAVLNLSKGVRGIPYMEIEDLTVNINHSRDTNGPAFYGGVIVSGKGKLNITRTGSFGGSLDFSGISSGNLTLNDEATVNIKVTNGSTSKTIGVYQNLILNGTGRVEITVTNSSGTGEIKAVSGTVSGETHHKYKFEAGDGLGNSWDATKIKAIYQD